MMGHLHLNGHTLQAHSGLMRGLWSACVLGMILVSAAGCDAPIAEEVSSARGALYTPWGTKKAAMTTELNNYLANNAAEWDAFRYTSITEGVSAGPLASGIPSSMLNNWPSYWPSIWGDPVERMARVGFGQDPYNPSNTTPFGLGKFMCAAQFGECQQTTCGGCHMGKVITNTCSPTSATGCTVLPIPGAPNTTFNNLAFRLHATTQQDDWEDHYPVFNFMAESIRNAATANGQRLADTLEANAYNTTTHPLAPNLRSLDKPGYTDAVGLGTIAMCDPAVPGECAEVLSPMAAEVDIMSVWRMGARTNTHWGGDIQDQLYRNLTASAIHAYTATGDADYANYTNAVMQTNFTRDLPQTPYPFAVDDAKAARGQVLFDQYCASCHRANNTTLYPPQNTAQFGCGTGISAAVLDCSKPLNGDIGRALLVTTNRTGVDPARDFVTRFPPFVRPACDGTAAECDVPDSTLIRDPNVVGRGYMAEPLDGIWARAPYLHNGSVPTLYHLLMPQYRPSTFVRGNPNYDTGNVGFIWNVNTNALTARTRCSHMTGGTCDTPAPYYYPAIYDTGLDSHNRFGHSTLAFIGKSWETDLAGLLDLLEYLKTL